MSEARGPSLYVGDRSLNAWFPDWQEAATREKWWMEGEHLQGCVLWHGLSASPNGRTRSATPLSVTPSSSAVSVAAAEVSVGVGEGGDTGEGGGEVEGDPGEDGGAATAGTCVGAAMDSVGTDSTVMPSLSEAASAVVSAAESEACTCQTWCGICNVWFDGYSL